MNRLFVLLCSISTCLTMAGQSADTSVKSVYIGLNYEPSIFPESWRKAPISAFGEKLSPEEAQRSKIVILKALAKYHEGTLRNITGIYFLKQMKFYNVPFGGTNSNDRVYLVNQGLALGYTEKYLEQTFHHEFSSILFRKFPAFLDTTTWKAANHMEFSYNDPENGVGAIRNKLSSQELDTLLCQKGLLTQYGGSSIENDVNTFAQNLFTPEKNFWVYVDRYPRIREKTIILISFYNKIHALFTEQYFRKFGN